MRIKLLTGALALVVAVAAGFVTASPVDKATVKNPATVQVDPFFAPIGAGVRVQGPGAFTSVTAAAAVFLSLQTGTLSKTGEGTAQLVYTHSGTDTHYRLFASVLGGFQFCYAKKWGSGSGSCANTLTYSVAKTVDGVSSIGLSGSQAIGAAAGAVDQQVVFKPLFKFTGGLLVFNSGATVTTNVKSSSTIDNTNPSFVGAANGQAIGFNFGT